MKAFSAEEEAFFVCGYLKTLLQNGHFLPAETCEGRGSN